MSDNKYIFNIYMNMKDGHYCIFRNYPELRDYHMKRYNVKMISMDKIPKLYVIVGKINLSKQEVDIFEKRLLDNYADMLYLYSRC